MRKSIETEKGLIHVESLELPTRPGEVIHAYVEDDRDLPSVLRDLADAIEMDLNGTDPVVPFPDDQRWHIKIVDKRPVMR